MSQTVEDPARRRSSVARLTAGLVAALMAIMVVASTRTASTFETHLLHFLRTTVDRPGIGCDSLREVMLSATGLGAFPTLLLVTALAAGLLTSLGRGATAMRLVAAAGLGVGGANILKVVVNRPRPHVVEHWVPVSSPSFPSGHAADAAIVYLLLAALAADALAEPRARRFVLTFAIMSIGLIGLSRLYLGVHWPTDVAGGWCLGAAWVIATKGWVRGRRP